ncbi:MAG: dTMP kinase [Chloroflexi bacterium]|nr:dTMP kinase [Chloroflexota bacterium]
MDGAFFTFEGIDGAGKTTQLRRVAERLEQLGYRVVRTREPGGTSLGEELRRLILPRSESPNHPLAELFLLSAARAQLVATVIVPALAQGRIVLADRFADATLAYQGYGRGLPLDDLRAVNRIATQSLKPTRTILLDLPLTTSAERLQARGRESFFDEAGVEFRERVRSGYQILAAEEPSRWRIVRGSDTQDAVFSQVWASIMEAVPVRVINTSSP